MLPWNHEYRLPNKFQNINVQNRISQKSLPLAICAKKFKSQPKTFSLSNFYQLLAGISIYSAYKKRKTGIHVYRHRRHNRFIKKQQQKTKSHFFNPLHIKSSPCALPLVCNLRYVESFPSKGHIRRMRRPAIAFCFSVLQRERAISINI